MFLKKSKKYYNPKKRPSGLRFYSVQYNEAGYIVGSEKVLTIGFYL